MRDYQYLLRVKRVDENGKEYVEASICNAKQVCDFVEYIVNIYDLECDVIDYYISLIDEKNVNKLHRVYFTSITTSYKYGSHYMFICKGKPKYDEEADPMYAEPLNYIDSVFYRTDH